MEKGMEAPRHSANGPASTNTNYACQIILFPIAHLLMSVLFSSLSVNAFSKVHTASAIGGDLALFLKTWTSSFS